MDLTSTFEVQSKEYTKEEEVELLNPLRWFRSTSVDKEAKQKVFEKFENLIILDLTKISLGRHLGLLFQYMKFIFANIVGQSCSSLILRIQIYLVGSLASLDVLSAVALDKSIGNLFIYAFRNASFLTLVKHGNEAMAMKKYREVYHYYRSVCIMMFINVFFLAFPVYLFIEEILSGLGFPKEIARLTEWLSLRMILAILCFMICALTNNYAQIIGDMKNVTISNGSTILVCTVSIVIMTKIFKMTIWAYLIGGYILGALSLLVIVYLRLRVIGRDCNSTDKPLFFKFFVLAKDTLKNYFMALFHFLELEILISMAGGTQDTTIIAGFACLGSFANFCGVLSSNTGRVGQMILGRAVGRRDAEGSYKLFKYFLMINFLLGGLLALFICVFSQLLASWTTIDPTVMAEIKTGLRIMSVGIAFLPNHHLTMGTLSILSRRRYFFAINIFSNYVVGIGSAYILTYKLGAGVQGLAFGLSLGMVVRVILGIIYLLKLDWKTYIEIMEELDG